VIESQPSNEPDRFAVDKGELTKGPEYEDQHAIERLETTIVTLVQLKTDLRLRSSVNRDAQHEAHLSTIDRVLDLVSNEREQTLSRIQSDSSI
jgi:hypothetical protein